MSDYNFFHWSPWSACRPNPVFQKHLKETQTQQETHMHKPNKQHHKILLLRIGLYAIGSARTTHRQIRLSNCSLTHDSVGDVWY